MDVVLELDWVVFFLGELIEVEFLLDVVLVLIAILIDSQVVQDECQFLVQRNDVLMVLYGEEIGLNFSVSAEDLHC